MKFLRHGFVRQFLKLWLDRTFEAGFKPNLEYELEIKKLGIDRLVAF